MDKDNTYQYSISMAVGLSTAAEEAGDFSSFIRIRRELNHFLLSLNYSNQATGIGQQIHFLYLALDHLENMEREIRISPVDENVLHMAKIQDKIQSLKRLILGYIRHLTSENRETAGP